MSNLRVFDPFAVDNFEDLFRNFLRPAQAMAGLAPTQIKLDIDEVDNSYMVKAELPGVKKEDIHVDIDGNLVSIQAEVKNEKEVKKEGKTLRSERYYGAMSRAFTLGSEIDDAGATAKFENGVLQLTLPKKASAQTKRISVQ